MTFPGGPGGGMEMLMRSMRRGQNVEKRKIGRATAKRILAFAKPYRREIGFFLIIIVAAAIIGVITPVLAGEVIRTIGLKNDPSAGAKVVQLALIIAGLAVVGAVLSLFERWFSARIGEGLIFDLRTHVYDHVQRMPLQFFTRAQTGALVSRLNNDVMGAQRAFTSTLSSWAFARWSRCSSSSPRPTDR